MNWRHICKIVFYIALLIVAIFLLLEVKASNDIQRENDPWTYREAKYYNVTQEGQYLIRDEIGYVWKINQQINTDDALIIKVNIGQDFYSKDDDILVGVYKKIG